MTDPHMSASDTDPDIIQPRIVRLRLAAHRKVDVVCILRTDLVALMEDWSRLRLQAETANKRGCSKP